jgi:hypothetical protein
MYYDLHIQSEPAVGFVFIVFAFITISCFSFWFLDMFCFNEICLYFINYIKCIIPRYANMYYVDAKCF